MIRPINLLPWRERERRRRQTLLFWHMIGGIAVSAVLVLSHWLFWQSRLQIQQERLVFLERERSALYSGRTGLAALTEWRERTRAERAQEQHLRDRTEDIHSALVLLAEARPESLHLRSLRARAGTFTATGEAYPSAALNEFLNALEGSAMLRNIRVDELGAVSRTAASPLAFRLHFKFDREPGPATMGGFDHVR